jgi:hypothetical protein
MSLYEQSVPHFTRLLRNLQSWLDAAEGHAKAKGFDAQVLLQSRLAPDQFPLLKQIQIACDAAKNTAARIAGKEPPAHPDTEQTLTEVRARIATALAYLASLERSDFDGADDRRVTLPVFQGKSLSAPQYLFEYGTPNFYFHITTAYAILRHNGVDLGKKNFLGQLSLA